MKTKKPVLPRRMSNKQRLEELRTFVSLCFAVMGEPDLKEISNRTRLSVTTLRRIQTNQLTLAVRFGTIQALGLAAGLRLEMTESASKVVLV